MPEPHPLGQSFVAVATIMVLAVIGMLVGCGAKPIVVPTAISHADAGCREVTLNAQTARECWP
jgi:hypothetical protein